MTPSDLTTAPDTPVDRMLEFPNNRLLIDLCGAFDAHLATIEKALEVQIVRRGNHLSILGDAEAADRAATLLNDFLPGKQLAKLLEEKRIEIAPLAFMRGRTLANAFVVLDEAQNATSMQMKMFLTRLGEGSRMVITGDRTQIDLPRGVASGLADAERLLKTIPKISFNYFTSKDVVRHPLVAAIIEAYEADTGTS